MLKCLKQNNNINMTDKTAVFGLLGFFFSKLLHLFIKSFLKYENRKLSASISIRIIHVPWSPFWDWGPCLGPWDFDVRLSLQENQTVSCHHKVTLYQLCYIKDHYIQYQRPLWYQPIVWRLSRDQQTSKSHKTKVPYLSVTLTADFLKHVCRKTSANTQLSPCKTLQTDAYIP